MEELADGGAEGGKGRTGMGLAPRWRSVHAVGPLTFAMVDERRVSRPRDGRGRRLEGRERRESRRGWGRKVMV